MHSNQHWALAKILAFNDPSPPILLQLLSKKKYFHPAGLPCNKTSQNLCANLQTGQFSGIWALPAVIYSLMWHLFPAQWHWQGLQQALARAMWALAKRATSACPGGRAQMATARGWRERSSLLLQAHHPAGNGAWALSPRDISSALCVILSFFCPFTRQGTPHQTKLTVWIPETLDGCKFQLISIALI